jgi:hypothetical protein
MEAPMTKVTYEIVPHDGGWAYMVGNVYSESFPTHGAARRAAVIAAKTQRVSGATTGISWEDAQGHWHNEVSEGGDRPETEVRD